MWPLAARAQQGDRVGLLAAMMGGRNADTDLEGRAWFAAFRQGLQELGWVEGRNFRADYRWPSGDLDRMRAIAKEFSPAGDGAVTARTRHPGYLNQRFRSASMSRQLYSTSSRQASR